MRTQRARRLLAGICIAASLGAGIGAAGATPVDQPSGGGGWGTPRDPRRDPSDPGPREPTEECDDEGNCECVEHPPMTSPPETSPPSILAADC